MMPSEAQEQARALLTPEDRIIEDSVYALHSISLNNWWMLMDEVKGWRFALREGLVTQYEAEARATQRAAKILRRLAAADSAP
jgi:hypothetical protein